MNLVFGEEGRERESERARERGKRPIAKSTNFTRAKDHVLWWFSRVMVVVISLLLQCWS